MPGKVRKAGSAEAARDELLTVAMQGRAVFEHALETSLDHRRTNGTCLFAAVLCAALLGRFTAAQVVVRGGDGEGDGGLFLGEAAHGHYWVEATCDGEVYVVDLTADQFGLPGVIVVSASAVEATLGARYVCGEQQTVDEHAQEIRASMGLP